MPTHAHEGVGQQNRDGHKVAPRITWREFTP
jgi:hypothetical protein